MAVMQGLTPLSLVLLSVVAGVINIFWYAGKWRWLGHLQHSHFFFFSQCFSETVPVCPFFGWAVVAATLAHLSLPTASPVHPCALCKFSF